MVRGGFLASEGLKTLSIRYAWVDRPRFWSKSLLDFPTTLALEPQHTGDFLDVLPRRGLGGSRRFGVLLGCLQHTRASCRLPVGLWRCYAWRQRDTEVWYREHQGGYDRATRREVCAEAQETGFVRRNGSTWSFNALPFSSLCRLYHGALSDFLSSKQVALEVFGSYEWHLMVDGGDVSIGPGCHDQSLEKLISAAPKEAEVIVKDPSEPEDSNSGARKLVFI